MTLPTATPSPSAEVARWEVGCQMDFEVTEPASVAVVVAVARRPALRIVDTFGVYADGAAASVDPTVVDGSDGRRTHLLRLPAGRFSLVYDAEVVRPEPTPISTAPVSPAERLLFLRPSRYCPSDRLGGWARREFDPRGTHDPADPDAQAQLADSVTSWVFERTDYVLGSSGGSDDAIDTLLSSQGVCRDFAHLVVTICRALDLPARLAAVYAPGLSPMDFHAVAEIDVADHWSVYDATALAPRSMLVRVATGRDAADTAFVTVSEGQAELTATTVRAVSDGDLPPDTSGRVNLA
jgi:transglutaminase-like putative cysteine protease